MLRSNPMRWSVDDIAFDQVCQDRHEVDEGLFYQIVSASFIEITSDLYTGNLIEYFDDDREITEWLKNHWEREELQHGTALRRYVEAAWPHFDWERAYRAFHEEYAATCRIDALEPSRARELVARCVVEMGTATAYRSLESLTREPVLRQLANHIKTDEIRHYKHFYRFFRRYRDNEKIGRLPVARTLYGRLGTFNSADIFIAFKHIFTQVNPRQPFSQAAYARYKKTAFRMAKDSFPFEMGVKMWLKPLELGPVAQRAAVPLLSAGAKHILMH